MIPLPLNREIKLLSPVLPPPHTLHFRRMHAREGLSRLFEYDVELLSHSETIDLDKVLGQTMTISLEVANRRKRFFHGYVSSFQYVDSDGDWNVYRARLVPHLWKLTRTANCRIFQNEAVPDIVAMLLREHGIGDIETHYAHPNRDAYKKWEYCVQYRETDFNFASRLLEHEGIHYFFKHEETKHTLVLTDSLAGHVPATGYEVVPYRLSHQKGAQPESVWGWQVGRTVLPGSYAGRDYDFLDPKAALVRGSGSDVPRGHAKPHDPDYEVFDYPEPVVQQEGYSAQFLEDMARIRIEEAHAQYETITARTDARGLHAGALFKVSQHPRGDQNDVEFLITAAEFHLYMDAMVGGASGGGEPVFECDLQAINSRHTFRPPRVTPKPLIQGLQSATVAGPNGEKVWTDKYGRVKVQFHWDREGRPGEAASCWTRVAQTWAGTNWGAMFLPHVGQEVLVGFLEGDPDRPVVIGRVYNANHMPPLTLPDNRHKSIIRDHFGNEIVMDGTPGKEHMSFHSPSHHSMLQLGRSTNLFTHSHTATRSLDSTSFHLGKKLALTRGWSVSLDQGAWFSGKVGVGASVTLASEITASAGMKGAFTAGGAYTLSAGWSFSWGVAEEVKLTSGAYKRSSEGNAYLDSHKTVFVTGGKNDNTMLLSDDEKLELSFDDTQSNRSDEMKKVDAAAREQAARFGGLVAALSGLSAWGYNQDIPSVGPQRDPNAATAQIDADFHGWSSVLTGDAGMAVATAATVVQGFKGSGFKLSDPTHPNPNAKITLKKDFIELFTGRNREVDVKLGVEEGIILGSKKDIVIGTEESAVDISAKKAITLKSGDAVVVDCKLKHRNFEVLP